MGYILVRRDGRLVLEQSLKGNTANDALARFGQRGDSDKQASSDAKPAQAGSGSGGSNPSERRVKLRSAGKQIKVGAQNLKYDAGKFTGKQTEKIKDGGKKAIDAGGKHHGKIIGGVGALGLAGLAAKGIKSKLTSNVDKAKEAAGTLKDVGKDAVDSLPTGAIAGGAAAALGGGIALKKYLKNRKKKAA
jgi:hypothetical protein